MRVLMERGANVDAKTTKNETPLHFAIQMGRLGLQLVFCVLNFRADIVQELCAHGADTDIPSGGGLSVVELAQRDESLAKVAQYIGRVVKLRHFMFENGIPQFVKAFIRVCFAHAALATFD